MSKDNLTERLLHDGESSKIEFKASPEAREGIAKAVCGFLNSNGGVVFVGVEDNGQPNGTANDKACDALRAFLHDAITPQVLFTVSLDQTVLGNVISVDVPAGPDRPYVFAGAAFVRRGASTLAADAATLRMLVEESVAGTTRWERRPAVELQVKDLDLGLLDETIRRGQDRRGYRFEDPKDRASVLSELSLMRFGQLTNAADVLFGAKVALRHPQIRMRAVCYATDRADNFLDEQLFEGPAFMLLEAAMGFVKRHVPIGSEFPEGQLARESKPKYPFNAIREGLVNALVHRDYAAFSGSTSLSIYPDRVEIWNTGHLPRGMSPRDLLKPSHDSILVNPDIGHAFYLHELMERVGRGTYKIVQECLNAGMRMPEWKNVSSGVRLTLFAAVAGDSSREQLNERQKALLATLPVGEQIQIHGFLERFGAGVSERQARRDLSDLETLGFLERRGAGSKTRFYRTDRSP